MKKAILIVMLFAVLLTACSSLDVVQKDAVRAFDDILSLYPAEHQDGWYQLTSPDGGAKLAYANDSVVLAVDASPFIDAGLEASETVSIAESVFYKNDLSYALPGWDMLNQNVKDGAAAQFEANAEYIRRNIGYHSAMDHYSIDFGGGMFEWAKDIAANDKDIVFALNPEPLIAAGVEPENVDGWTYALVPVMRDGKETQVYKFLKSFDLE